MAMRSGRILTFCSKRLFSTSSQLVHTRIENSVGIITLSDPTRLNALTVNMGESFKEAVALMSTAAKEQRIRAVVVTGDGDAFSAGGDLNWLMERHHTSPFKNSTIMVDFYNRFLCVRDIGVPTIAAINGAAIGAGMCMTLACDMRIAASSAKLGFTFAKLGIHPGMGSSLLLPRLVGQETASYLLLSGAILSGDEARQRGLVLESVPKVNIMWKILVFTIESVLDNTSVLNRKIFLLCSAYKYLGQGVIPRS